MKANQQQVEAHAAAFDEWFRFWQSTESMIPPWQSERLRAVMRGAWMAGWLRAINDPTFKIDPEPEFIGEPVTLDTSVVEQAPSLVLVVK